MGKVAITESQAAKLANALDTVTLAMRSEETPMTEEGTVNPAYKMMQGQADIDEKMKSKVQAITKSEAKTATLRELKTSVQDMQTALSTFGSSILSKDVISPGGVKGIPVLGATYGTKQIGISRVAKKCRFEIDAFL